MNRGVNSLPAPLSHTQFLTRSGGRDTGAPDTACGILRGGRSRRRSGAIPAGPRKPGQRATRPCRAWGRRIALSRSTRGTPAPCGTLKAAPRRGAGALFTPPCERRPRQAPATGAACRAGWLTGYRWRQSEPTPAAFKREKAPPPFFGNLRPKSKIWEARLRERLRQ